jgi:hypothetical protein
MVTLNDALIKHVRSGAVEPAEAFSKAQDKKDLISKFNEFSITFAAPPGYDK